MAIADGRDIYLTLRPRQVAYLQELSKWDEVPESQVFGAILEKYAPHRLLLAQRGGIAIRKHFASNPERADLLEALSKHWGIQRSEAARVLIDMAFAVDRLVR